MGDARVGNPNDCPALSSAVAPIWVTVEVPPNAREGDYNGQLAVNVAGQQIATVPIDLRVCRWKAAGAERLRHVC